MKRCGTRGFPEKGAGMLLKGLINGILLNQEVKSSGFHIQILQTDVLQIFFILQKLVERIC